MATEQAATMPSSTTSNDFFNYIVIYDTISAAATAPQYDDYFFCPPPLQPPPPPIAQPPPPPPPPPPREVATKPARGRGGGGKTSTSTNGNGGSKKRRRKARVCKNKEEAETQRMTHIAVERNRRKLMNEHLALLRSLMPPSYVQRGDQASIVAGATEFVKELEHLLHSLQAQKLQLANNQTELATPFPDFFNHYTSPHHTNKNHLQSPHSINTAAILTSSSSASPSSSSYNNNNNNGDDLTMNSNGNSSSGSMNCCGNNGNNVADVEVTLIETHANLRILLRKKEEGKKTAPLQLSKLVCGFHALGLGVLHFSLNTVHPFALYSVSAKVEEGCQLSSVEDIAAAVHHMLRLIVDQDDENLQQQHY